MRPCNANAAIIVLLLFSSLNALAQVKMKDHRKLVQKSAHEKIAVLSLDTLFCSGIPKALVGLSHNAKGEDSAWEIRSLVDGHTAIQIQSANFSVKTGEIHTYHRYSFPGLELACDVKQPTENALPFEQICISDLMNASGLDTVRAEFFSVLKGKITDVDGHIQLEATIDAEKSVIAKRDTNSMVLVEGEDLAQGGVLIGSFTAGKVPGPQGEMMQILIYNSVGALICTATQADIKTNTWGLLTYKNNRFSKTTLKGEDHLIELVHYLISKGFL